MDDEQIKRCKEELRRVLGSKTFRSAPMLSNFLAYATSEVLNGRGRYLTQDTIARVLGKGEDFDSMSNPLIRVQAGRLRAKLSDYYRSEGAENELQIQLPSPGYAPKFIAKADRDALDEPPPMTIERKVELLMQAIDNLSAKVKALETQLSESQSSEKTD